MARQIFIVNAYIVDANGSFSQLSGYPKTFDSKNYGDDIDKAQKRADGDASETWGAMCKRDDRLLQCVTLETVDGFQLYKKSMGRISDPDPEPSEV